MARLLMLGATFVVICPLLGGQASGNPNLAEWHRLGRFCRQYSRSADRLARLRILASQMRGALGSRNVAVRTTYVATRLRGRLSRRRLPRRSDRTEGLPA
jgi:hypothetical protein